MRSEIGEKTAAGTNFPPRTPHNRGLRIIPLCGAPHNRKGMEGPACWCGSTRRPIPFSGAVYVVRAKRADRIKLILWDGAGLCLFAKRLEEGVFRWPKIEDGVMRLSAAEFSALPEVLDWRRVHAARETASRIVVGRAYCLNSRATALEFLF